MKEIGGLIWALFKRTTLRLQALCERCLGRGALRGVQP